MRLSSIVSEARLGADVLVKPVPGLRALARGRAPIWPLVLAVTLAYGLSRPAALAANLAQGEHGFLAAIGLTLQGLLRFALPEWASMAAAGLGLGLLARARGARVRLSEHAVAGAYAALPALVIVGVWGAIRLAAPDLPRLDLPRSFGPEVLVLVPSLLVLAVHAGAVWRRPLAYAEPPPPRALRRARAQLDSSLVPGDGVDAGRSGAPMADLDPDLDPSSRDPRHGLVFLGVAAVGVLLVILGVLEKWNTVKPPGHGELAPDVTLPLLDGGEVRLSDLRGQVVVVDFWATWCPPCVESMPGLDRLVREKAGDGLVALAVNRDDGDAARRVRSFLAEHRLGSLRVALDGGAGAARAFRVQALPTMFVIDRDGTIVSSHVGGTSYGGLKDLVEPLLERP